HAYGRGGTAKRLTLLRPATGEVRARGVTRAPTTVLPPGLRAVLTQMRPELPRYRRRPPVARRPRSSRPGGSDGRSWPTATTTTIRPCACSCSGITWPGTRRRSGCTGGASRAACPSTRPGAARGCPGLRRSSLSVRRAVDGQHPRNATAIITWLEETVAGGNAGPPPFVWDGKRRERRQRARQRR